jgi:DtxR family Mn-dependent transcriptional regulator
VAGHSTDEYLETIYFLAFPIGEYRPVDTALPTLSSRIAEMLGVSRAAAGEMLKRLETEGLVERGEHKEALLTPVGRERAEKVVRKHRIIERLLTDFMGYTASESHVHADELGDTFTDDMIQRIEEKLGHPDRCPHGWPIDTEFEQVENKELSALAEVAAGSDAVIARRRAPPLVLRPGARAGREGHRRGGRARRGPAARARRRRAEGDRREGRRRALRPRGLDLGPAQTPVDHKCDG